MGIFDKITKGITRGIGNAVSNAVQKKTTEALTPQVDKLADKIVKTNPQTQTNGGQAAQSSDLAAATARLAGAYSGAVQNYATEAAKNIKVCPSCGKPASADKKFCPECGAVMPQTTLADCAVCSACGKQNGIGEKFCSDCGAKLPAAIEEDRQSAQADEDTMARWDEFLSAYPKWNCGGSGYNLERFDGDRYMFAARFADFDAAKRAVEQYRASLRQSGFAPAGQYPSEEHLYKKTDGGCFHADTEHCFEGDSDCPTVYFDNEEPYGGFDYKKEEPKKKKGFFGLFG